MQLFSETLQFQTDGEIDIVDLTHKLDSLVTKSGIKEGILTANVIGSTGALTAIEYDSLVKHRNELYSQLADVNGESGCVLSAGW